MRSFSFSLPLYLSIALLDQVGINSNRNNEFNFVAAADWRCNMQAHATITNMQNKSPELMLTLRDLSC